MEPLNFSRSPALNNLPAKKIQDYYDSINSLEEDDKIKHIRLIAANRYAESNIPMLYWDLKMEKHFFGDPRLLKKYNEYTSDLKSIYVNGKSLCLAGNYGIGKSLAVSCILKAMVQRGYSCLYTTLSDVVSVLTQSDDKYNARKELSMVDMLCVDEVDSRFISSDNSADLFARTLEGVFRTRIQNKLPTLMCTNSPNIVEAFKGTLKDSITSLMKGNMEMFPVFGNDFRKIDPLEKLKELRKCLFSQFKDDCDYQTFDLKIEEIEKKTKNEQLDTIISYLSDGGDIMQSLGFSSAKEAKKLRDILISINKGKI